MSKLNLKRIFAFRLTQARIKNMLSQAELAELVDLSRCSITNMEAGRQDTTLTTLERLAQALGVRPDQLLNPPRKGSTVPVLVPRIWRRKYRG